MFPVDLMPKFNDLLIRVTSHMCSFTKSQPRSLLSIARLNKASSRGLFANCKRIRIAQISFSLRGDFGPINLPLSQGKWLQTGFILVKILLGPPYIRRRCLRSSAVAPAALGLRHVSCPRYWHEKGLPIYRNPG